MCNEQWICYKNLSVFGKIENLWMEISWITYITCLAGEFMAYYASKNAEVNLKSTTTDGFNFQKFINSLMESFVRYAFLVWL